MTDKNQVRIRIGQKFGENLTILVRLTRRSPDPVFLVWNHASWCPMVCKIYRSPRRARREADALSSLSHPNIVRCFGLFEPTHILIEYLEGPTVEGLMRKQRSGRLPVADAIRLCIHVGGALDLMHSKGILHLDVKPANIIVVNGRPVLFDFGSMRRVGAQRPELVAGTDPYIAPEEIQLGDATPATDVFSLGVTMFEMLTGRLPFPAQTSSANFPQLKHDPFPLRKFVRRAPVKLEALLAACLSRDPAKRPQLSTLLPALNALLGDDTPMWPADFHPELRLPPDREYLAQMEPS